MDTTELKRYDVDPVLLCRCGAYQSGNGMVAILGGRYVEADEALAEIESLQARLDTITALLNAA